MRALIATKEVERAQNLARGLRTRPDAERLLLRAFVKGDPLDAQLRIPAIAVVDALDLATMTFGKRRHALDFKAPGTTLLAMREN